MLGALFAVALLFTDTVNPIQAAIDYYRQVASYRVTLKSTVGGKTEIIRYYFKKPGYVRMEFVTPFKGAVLVYDPVAGQAKLWPFGYHSFPSLSLSPANSLIRSTTGQRVDRSDVGVLYENVKALQDHGKTEIVGVETVGGQEAMHVVIDGEGGFSVGSVSRYQLWLDQVNGFPLKVLSHDAGGRVIEAVEMDELMIAPGFPDGFFKQ